MITINEKWAIAALVFSLIVGFMGGREWGYGEGYKDGERAAWWASFRAKAGKPRS